MHNFSIFLLILLSCTINTALSEICDKLLNELALTQGKFVSCNTHHALPIGEVRLCEGCILQYNAMAKDYDNLMKNGDCVKKYMNLNRINIVVSTQNAVEGLWKRAFCDDCFKGNNSENFTDLFLDVKACLDLNKAAHSECINCALKYITMNNFYTNLDKQNNGNMCFDMQDMMNRTRVRWSKELKCCQREVKMSLFLISIGLVTVLPILLFYSVAIVLTKRREANHGLLNDQEPELDAPSTARLITAAILSTRSEQPEVVDAKIEKIADLLNRRNKNVNGDDDDDDDSDDDHPLH